MGPKLLLRALYGFSRDLWGQNCDRKDRKGRAKVAKKTEGKSLLRIEFGRDVERYHSQKFDIANSSQHSYAGITENEALRHLINWLLSALAVWVVSQFIPGFHVANLPAALVAALVIGLVNATLGLLLKIITFPLTILTLGIFWIVINALMLELASAIVPGFRIDSFASAFWGAIVLSLVNMLFRWLAGTSRRDT